MPTLKSLAAFFGLKRNLVVLLVSIFVIGAGEELWMRFVPKYLQAVGATVFVIGLYDALRTLLGAIYAYPGGVLADRWGHRHAFIIFNVVSIIGYALVLLIPNWGGVIVGMFLFLSWTCFSLPATFSLVGAALEAHRHSMGIGVQSVIKRLPIMIAPIFGGMLIDHFGIIPGVRIGLVVSIFLSALTILVQRQLREESKEQMEPVQAELPLDTSLTERWNFWRSLREFNQPMRRLLLSDILIRFCERVPYAWVVIFAMDYIGVSAQQVGVLTAIEMLAATLCIIPASHYADRYRREPFVIVTFIMFTLFPISLLMSRSFSGSGHRVYDPRIEGIWRYIAQGTHHRIQRPRQTRPNDRFVLSGPRLGREHRRNPWRVFVETRTSTEFSRSSGPWSGWNDFLYQNDSPKQAISPERFEKRVGDAAKSLELAMCFIASPDANTFESEFEIPRLRSE